MVFLKLLTEASDPCKDIRVTWRDIAALRGVKLRKGVGDKLRKDLESAVVDLYGLRVSLEYKGRHNGNGKEYTLRIGKDCPESLFNLVDIQLELDGKTWKEFVFRANRALTFFLNQKENRRWVGYYSRALLQLNPKDPAKRIGNYWLLHGVTRGKYMEVHKATPRQVLEWCGIKPRKKNRKQTVDLFIGAHELLKRLKVLHEVPLRPKPGKGYFEKWLDTPIQLKLHPDLWEVNRMGDGKLTKMIPKYGKGSRAQLSHLTGE